MLNTTVLNTLFTVAISFKAIDKRMPLLIIFGFIICVIQLLLIADFQNFLKSVLVYLILLSIFKLRHKIDEIFITSTHKVFISVHSLSWVYFMFTGWQFGRSDGKAFAGFFDEPSVASFVLGTYLVCSNRSKLLSVITIVLIALADSLTGVIFIAWYLICKNYFRYDIVLKLICAFAIAYIITLQTDWRLNKELLQILLQIPELSSVDASVRASSTGFRILYEMYYAWEVIRPLNIESFFGGTYFPQRTASLNVVTELLLTIGFIWTISVIMILVAHFRLHQLPLRKIGGLLLLCCSTGAFLKPVFILCLLLIFSQRNRV
jgi:hypothetical protein